MNKPNPGWHNATLVAASVSKDIEHITTEWELENGCRVKDTRPFPDGPLKRALVQESIDVLAPFFGYRKRLKLDSAQNVVDFHEIWAPK